MNKGVASYNSESKARVDRLLLLRHASKCTLQSGKCPEPFCDSIKKLWSHINECREKECTEPHCVSSRFLLWHYKTCKDPECQACKPVKEAVAKEQGSSELQLRIKTGTDRLLLLRHASKCTIQSSKCPEPFCDNMKKLWSHINKCWEIECTEPHCVSSRVLLWHYKTCKDPECQACKPVKEAVAKEQQNKTELMSSSKI